MSRSGYTDDGDNWAMIKWRGAVASAIRGRRGQAFLSEMLTALEVLSARRLISGEFVKDGEVCAMGAVGLHRGVAGLHEVDPYDRETIASTFGIPSALAAEIMYENDEGGSYWREETPERRWARVRAWVASKIKGEVST